MASREIVGVGATAEIVAWGDGKVAKLFRDPVLNDMVAMESADVADLPVLALGTVPEQPFCVLHRMDFGAAQATGFQAEIRLDSEFGAEAAWIEIRLDKPDGQCLGVCQAASRDLGLNTWGTIKTGLYLDEGIHDIYLRCRGFGARKAWLRQIRLKTDPDITLFFDGVALPARAPYLGPLEDYFLGSGEVGGGGDTKGIWNSLIGPGYTFYGYIKSNESLIRREEIRLVVDGQELTLDFEMRRVRSSGLFFGFAEARDLRVMLIEFANRGETWLPRLVMTENMSPDTGHAVTILADILADGAEHRLVADRAVTIAHGCDNPRAKKHALIGFIGESATAAMFDPTQPEQGYRLSSGLQHLTPRGETNSTLVSALLHGMHRDDQTPEQLLADIEVKDAAAIQVDVGHCLHEWQSWLAGSQPLARLAHGRDRDLVEGGLVIIRMLQGCDGGMMATARSYMDSYVRDSAGALRGLTAFGFTREAESFLMWAQHKFDLTQMIVCNANIGDDDNWFPGYGTADNWAAESPALYLLTARDYLYSMTEAGREQEAWQFLSGLDRTLRFAAEVQLASLIKHDWLLRFNGDETESGGAGIPLLDRPDLEHDWSMPSLALCASSLVFYSLYLQKQRLDPGCFTNTITGETTSLPSVLDAVKGSLDRHFWRTDLPEYPEGFYDWYRTESGGWPDCRITNYSLFPICYETPLHQPERARQSAAAMKIHFTASGYLPIQPGGPGEGFCGHDLGYLLQALVKAGDPLADDVYTALTGGGTMGCWGTWSEAYTSDGMTHTLPDGDSGYRTANMRPFETGINLAAIRAYLDRIKQLS